MSDKIYSVTINGKPYSKAFQTKPEHADAWKSVLVRAHSGSDVRCTCPGSGPRKLAVRSRAKNDSFHLARYPKKGFEHAIDCQYYSEAEDKSGRGGYVKGVVEETDDGFNIKLKLSLQTYESADGPAADKGDAKASSTRASRTRASQAAMSLGGLLHFLWSEAGLNRWSPGGGKRWLDLVHVRLIRAAGKIFAAGTPIENDLVVSISQKGDQEAANRNKVRNAITKKRRLLAIVVLAKHSPEAERGMAEKLAYSGFFGMPQIGMSEDLWTRTVQRYPQAIAAWRGGHRVVAIVQTDPPVGYPPQAAALNIALMIVSDQFIPAESQHELKIEEKLRQENRAFIKPMRFDSEYAPYFPDFWLTDIAARHIPLEVFGMATADYLTQKKDKIAHNNDEYGQGNWWFWDAHSDPEGAAIPPFPLAVVS